MDYEKLGAFYLGREVDPETLAPGGDPLLYDSGDLTTHAVIVGMTGSGKTGLGVALIEEAALDGVPVLAIDPKGDLGNLALTFPQLRPQDFEPWLDPVEAENQGTDLSSYARHRATEWREGLAAWDQGGERIERLRAAATVSVYTPGSRAGRPISVLRSFAAPTAAVLGDADLLAERLATTTTSLLTLLGHEADPLSREHILLANLLEHFWRAGRDLSLTTLIQGVQSPPFDALGVMALETVFPAKERLKLAMALNSLVAAPGFEAWIEGEPLDVQDLLYEKSGKPRVAVIAINHLSDTERMFFLGLLLSEVVAWTRSQTGTGSLRALVYLDELFGFLPPVAEPPTKKPLLTLLKQARAFGVGLALSTQNPVDLDYKALANAGTWFIGRLQTERDVDRLIDGLRSSSGGTDAAGLAATIGRLPKRTFLLHNVHEREPVTFQTRWVMSYLAGPLSREQLRRLSQLSTVDSGPGETTGSTVVAATASASSAGSERADARRPAALQGVKEPPFLPPHVSQVFVGISGSGTARPDETAAPTEAHGPPHASPPRYFPFVMAVADAHYSSKTHGVEHGERVARVVEPVESSVPVDWALSQPLAVEFDAMSERPLDGADFAPLPALSFSEKELATWITDFGRWLRTDGALQLFSAKEHKLTSRPGEGERDFRLRCAQAARELRDDRKAKLRARFGSKLDSLQRRILREQQAVGRERQQLQHRAVDAVGSLVGALFGNRRGSTAISGAIRKASGGSKDYGDVQRAEERLEQALRERLDLEAELERELSAVEALNVHPDALELETIAIRPSSRDVVVRFAGVAWVLHRQVDGRWVPAVEKELPA